tara:strand:+ start:6255 stop:8765 length:2511 start_codon:yes stop_codon:yes gene_type:complete
MVKHSILLGGLILALSGCGGGSSGGGDKGATEILSGTAAAGAAIIGQVSVKGSAGNSISTDIEADGSYSVDVSTLVAPYMLRAVGNVGGKQYKLHSFAEESDVGGTVNITPFTDLILANVAGELAASHFEDGDFSDFTPELLKEQETALQNKLANVLSALGVSDGIDLLRTRFNADHSGLDAALDIIRIETNPETNIATLTNFIDGQSIEDDISSIDDEVAPLLVENSADLSAAQLDFLAMSNRVSTLTALFASSLPQTSQLDSLFADDMLNNDQGKSQFLTDISTDPSIIGISFGNVAYEEYNQIEGTSLIQFSITRNGVVEPEPVIWYMAKNNNVWQFRGDQEVADIWFGFICHFTPEYNSMGCGVNVGVEDNDFSNTPGAADTPIASAKMTLVRDGDLVPGSEIYLGLPDGRSAGELAVYDDDFGDDYIGFGSTWSEIPASVFQAGDVIQIELYTETLDIGSAQNPQIDPSATPVQTVTRSVIAAPVSQASVGQFPSVSAATINALAQYSDGNLDVEWTVPIGITIDEIWLEAQQGVNSLRVDDRNNVGASDTTTIVLDTSSLDISADNFTKELRVYGKNTSGQNFLTSYNADGVLVVEEEEEPVPNGELLSSLVGTWEFTDMQFSQAGYDATFLTLTETGEFFFFNHDSQSDDSCREVGYEYGTYSSNSEAISLSRTIDTNGCIGIFDSQNTVTLALLAISTNLAEIQFSDEASSFNLQRVGASNEGIVGTWHEQLEDNDNGLSEVLLLLEDGTFYIMDANPSIPTENDFKYGDYELNTGTNVLSLFFAYNSEDSTNGDEAIIPDVVVSGNKLIFDGDEINALDRVANSSPE